jgi:hypothetical protein
MNRAATYELGLASHIDKLKIYGPSASKMWPIAQDGHSAVHCHIARP